jgi:hypothetical protein
MNDGENEETLERREKLGKMGKVRESLGKVGKMKDEGR